jgi:hypothetical protein
MFVEDWLRQNTDYSKDLKLLPSRIRMRIRNKLISRIRIRNYHWWSGVLKNKCSDKNTIFNIKSSISAQKWPSNVKFLLKMRKNVTKISVSDPDPKRSEGRIRIRIRNQVGSGSGSQIIVSDPQLWKISQGSDLLTYYILIWRNRMWTATTILYQTRRRSTWGKWRGKNIYYLFDLTAVFRIRN